MQIIQELNIKIGQIIRQLNLLNSDEVTRSIEKIANANIRLDKYLLDSGVLTEAQITTIYSIYTKLKNNTKPKVYMPYIYNRN